MAPPRLPPWETKVSVLADLPTFRRAWLARVLRELDAAPSLVAADASLGVPRGTTQRWLAWLRAAQDAGTLPERARPLPTFAPGFASANTDPAASGRKGAEAKHGGAAKKAAAKPAPKKRARKP